MCSTLSVTRDLAVRCRGLRSAEVSAARRERVLKAESAHGWRLTAAAFQPEPWGSGQVAVRTTRRGCQSESEHVTLPGATVKTRPVDNTYHVLAVFMHDRLNPSRLLPSRLLRSSLLVGAMLAALLPLATPVATDGGAVALAVAGLAAAWALRRTRA